jgi:hypothetical protein
MSKKVNTRSSADYKSYGYSGHHLSLHGKDPESKVNKQSETFKSTAILVDVCLNSGYEDARWMSIDPPPDEA